MFPSPACRQRGAVQPVLIWTFVFLIVGGFIIGWNYMVNEVRRGYDEVPRAYNLRGRNLELLDREGERISLFEIAEQDKPWVVGTFYTYCPERCAGVAEELLRVDEELGRGRVNFVLISFDPGRDRPEVLRAWADRHGLDGDNWYLLTAPEGMSEEVIFDYLQEPLKMWRPKWRLTENGERDYNLEPEHPMNVLALTDQDIRASYTVGLNPALTTPAQVRQSVRELTETLEKLIDEEER